MIHADLNTLTSMARDAFKNVDPMSLAFLFASGKSEGYLRDQLGIFLSSKMPLVGEEHVTREWKKHDLAIMDGNEPVALIEGKSWICHDAYRRSKLLTDKKSIFSGALNDVKKLLETKDKYPNVKIFISTIIYGVNTGMQSNYERFNITYADSHNKGILSAGSFPKLVDVSRFNASTLHKAFGPTQEFPIQLGRYHGMDVHAIFFLSEIQRSAESNLQQKIREAIG